MAVDALPDLEAVPPRTVLVATDAPPLSVRALDAQGTWEVSPEGGRVVRYPPGTGGVMRVDASGATWRPR